MREHRTTGTICVRDEYGIEFAIAKIEYILLESGSFRYVFTPFYNIIDIIPPERFQGIPGLNLELRRKEYVRENITPVFISERTPSENREDLFELLESVGMDYLDRLEWLIRTELYYGGDFLYVRRFKETDGGIEVDVEVRERRGIDSIRDILEHICQGDRIRTEDYYIDDSNRGIYYSCFSSLARNDAEYVREAKARGIRKAAKQGKYQGRKKKNIDFAIMNDVLLAYENGNIKEEEAASRLGISRATFYRRLKEYRGGGLE